VINQALLTPAHNNTVELYCRVLENIAFFGTAETMAKAKKSKTPDNTIAKNKSARFEFFVEETVEVGIELQGWEVKSLREKKLQLNESYVFVKNGELWLSGAHISPLASASTHVNPEPTRIRRLLAHRNEIDRLEGLIERKGYTLIALSAYWSRGRAKLNIGVAKGKKLHDKRATEKARDWSRDKARIMKNRG
jgi:SsrA-binding protein